MERSKKIIRIGLYGILINFLLVVFKAAVGVLSGSIAITLDALNNFSDMISSAVTIVATKMAKKPADEKHPFGHGRIEYLAAIIIAVIILFTGFTALQESVGKILSPTPSDYGFSSFIVLFAAVAVKLTFGLYLRKEGNKLNAQTLKASAADSFTDAAISGTTILYRFLGINIDGYIGAFISLVIIKTGIDVIQEAFSSLIGEHNDTELSEKIIKKVESFPQVHHATDLILHDYGPDSMIGSIHIEVDDTMDARQIDELSRKITSTLYDEYGIIFTVGVYAVNTTDSFIKALEEKIRKVALEQEGVIEVHGFYYNATEKKVIFDIVVDFTYHPRKELKKKLEALYPDLKFIIFVDYKYG